MPKRIAENLLAFFAFGLAYGTVWGLEFVGNWTEAEDNLTPEAWRRVRWAIFIIIAVGHGVFRAYWPSPLLRKDYGAWLSQTPWRHGLPAPLGAIWPGWIDGAWVVGLTMLGWTIDGLPWWVLPTIFVSCWTLTVFWACASRGSAVTWVAFGMPLMWYPWIGVWQVPVVIFALVSVVAWNYRQRLEGFPFEDGTWKLSADEIKAAEAKDLGWPFAVLAPDQPRPQTGFGAHSLTAGLLVWYLHSIWSFTIQLSKIDPVVGATEWDTLTKLLLVIWMFGVTLIALSSWVKYAAVGRPAMSLWARLQHRRWRLPGYDRVFLVPLAVLAVGSVFGLLIWLELWHLRATIEVGVFVVALTTSTVGPSIEEWKLTAPIRLSQQPVTTSSTAAKKRGKTITFNVRFAGRNI